MKFFYVFKWRSILKLTFVYTVKKVSEWVRGKSHINPFQVKSTLHSSVNKNLILGEKNYWVTPYSNFWSNETFVLHVLGCTFVLCSHRVTQSVSRRVYSSRVFQEGWGGEDVVCIYIYVCGWLVGVYKKGTETKQERRTEEVAGKVYESKTRARRALPTFFPFQAPHTIALF